LNCPHYSELWAKLLPACWTNSSPNVNHKSTRMSGWLYLEHLVSQAGKLNSWLDTLSTTSLWILGGWFGHLFLTQTRQGYCSLWKCCVLFQRTNEAWRLYLIFSHLSESGNIRDIDRKIRIWVSQSDKFIMKVWYLMCSVFP
jgi:hypothetical protein